MPSPSGSTKPTTVTRVPRGARSFTHTYNTTSTLRQFKGRAPTTVTRYHHVTEGVNLAVRVSPAEASAQQGGQPSRGGVSPARGGQPSREVSPASGGGGGGGLTTTRRARPNNCINTANDHGNFASPYQPHQFHILFLGKQYIPTQLRIAFGAKVLRDSPQQGCAVLFFFTFLLKSWCAHFCETARKTWLISRLARKCVTTTRLNEITHHV